VVTTHNHHHHHHHYTQTGSIDCARTTTKSCRRPSLPTVKAVFRPHQLVLCLLRRLASESGTDRSC
jgi:hypothetical protein